MSILSSQNIYGNAANRTIIEIDHIGDLTDREKGDVVTEEERESIKSSRAGIRTKFKETSVAPSQQGGSFGGPTSYEGDTQRGIARYYRADAEAPNKTDKSAYTVPDNVDGPYNGSNARNIVADNPIGTTRLSLFAKAADSYSVAIAKARVGDENMTIGNQQAVGIDDSNGGNTSRAAISFIGDGYTEWAHIGNTRSNAYGVTKKSGGHDFRNSYSNVSKYQAPNAYSLRSGARI